MPVQNVKGIYIMRDRFWSAPRRGYHHGNLRETLIEAARHLIAVNGPEGFSLIEAARLADEKLTDVLNEAWDRIGDPSAAS